MLNLFREYFSVAGPNNIIKLRRYLPILSTELLLFSDFSTPINYDKPNYAHQLGMQISDYIIYIRVIIYRHF